MQVLDRPTIEIDVDRFVEPSVTIGRKELQSMFGSGILSPLAYTYLIAKVDGFTSPDMRELNVVDFCDRWSCPEELMPEKESGNAKAKEFKPVQFRKAIAELQDKNMAAAGQKTIQLQLLGV